MKEENPGNVIGTSSVITWMCSLLFILAVMLSPISQKDRTDILLIFTLYCVHKSRLICKIDTDCKILITYSII
ncbi:MAG: hypothetical protein ACRCXX_08700, partial [Cetobacterium sp.]|uniref:hypothetical protein n=1 Tax=Cetobacterium sp. TaxID=2071632 RepID=UPI003F30CB99